MTVLFTIVVTTAFLSHTSSFAILSVACAIVAILFWWRGGVDAPRRRSGHRARVARRPHHRRRALLRPLRRHLSDAAVAPRRGDRGGGPRRRRPGHRQQAVGGAAVSVVLFRCAGTGADCRRSRLWRAAHGRSAAERLPLAMLGWALACLAFLVLGILTPVDMRYYLARDPSGRDGRGAWRERRMGSRRIRAPGLGRAAGVVRVLDVACRDGGRPSVDRQHDGRDRALQRM